MHPAVLLPALGLILLGSAFFSGTETALFGLGARDRLRLSRTRPGTAAAVDRLLSRPRLLLILVLLGNMVMNVLYMVITAAWALRAGSAGTAAAVSVGGLLTMILLGEAMPKTLAHSRRLWWCRWCVGPIAGLRGLLGPFLAAIERWVIEPLARLALPAGPAPHTVESEAREVRGVLARYQESGALSDREAALLREVSTMTTLRVRDIMTPRTRLAWVLSSAPRDAVLDAARTHFGAASLLVCKGSLDGGIEGSLDVRRYLAASARAGGSSGMSAHLEPVVFLPETLPLDSVMERLRLGASRAAVVVDEHGSVVGVVSVSDVVDRLLRGFVDAGSRGAGLRSLGDGVWEASGRTPLFDIAAEVPGLGIRPSPGVSTVAGLVMAELGRPAGVDDRVIVGGAQLVVLECRGTGIERVRFCAVAGGPAAGAGVGR